MRHFLAEYFETEPSVSSNIPFAGRIDSGRQVRKAIYIRNAEDVPLASHQKSHLGLHDRFDVPPAERVKGRRDSRLRRRQLSPRRGFHVPGKQAEQTARRAVREDHGELFWRSD